MDEDSVSSSEVSEVFGETTEEQHYITTIEPHLLGKCGHFDYLRLYTPLVHGISARLEPRWTRTRRVYADKNPKNVYYLSLEFLTGHSLQNIAFNLDGFACQKALAKLTMRFEDVEVVSLDPCLGSGCNGRLAACNLESMANLGIAAYGYGLHYEYGLSEQTIFRLGYVVDHLNWFRFNHPLEQPRPNNLITVKFYGHLTVDDEWVDYQKVFATPYDHPIPGYSSGSVNNLRLWSARATTDLSPNNMGDSIRAIFMNRHIADDMSPIVCDGKTLEAKELRLLQEYLVCSATIQDIMRRYYNRNYYGEDEFHEKNAIQLNDTHLSLAIPEMLLHILTHNPYLDWYEAWKTTTQSFAYTNHTVLSEALERWSCSLLEKVLPLHLHIIYQINSEHLARVQKKWPGDLEKKRILSLVEEDADGEKWINMAKLAIVGSHKVNGVSRMHSNTLKNDTFRYFHELDGDKFINITNGINHRRWLASYNEGFTDLINEHIGMDWLKDLGELTKLKPLINDAEFIRTMRRWKEYNREWLPYNISLLDIVVSDISIVDVQLTQINQHKRQLLNILRVIYDYNRIRLDPQLVYRPRIVIIAGKVAPDDHISKLVSQLGGCVARTVNNDPAVGDKLKLLVTGNNEPSFYHTFIASADLCEHIPAAGTSTSGAGNIKFSLNGALTISTMDSVIPEMCEEVGEDNMFIFGLRANEVRELKAKGYNGQKYCDEFPDLQIVVDQINNGFFSPDQPDQFKDLTDMLLHDDPYLTLADFKSYIECQARVEALYNDPIEWTKKCILNMAAAGKFSSDRAVKEYADKVWGAELNFARNRIRGDNL